MKLTRRAFVSAPGALALSTGAAAGTLDQDYSPAFWQTAICFPDDPYKTLVGNRGELLYGHSGPLDRFAAVIEFGLLGDNSRREQDFSTPVLETSGSRYRLKSFVTNRKGEGRIDNVLLEAAPSANAAAMRASAVITVRTRQEIASARRDNVTVVTIGPEKRILCVANLPLSVHDMGAGWVLTAPALPATPVRPLRCFFRFPQEGQSAETAAAGLADPDAALEWSLEFWRAWKPFGGEVQWKLPRAYDRFLLSCARNIQQAREVRDGKLTFQVGPTVYRGLWVVDGNFLLEAARYLGYDREAQQGLETTWSKQQDSGAVFATPGLDKHWKDTAIAMFTMVRAAELSGDCSYFERMQPNLRRGVEFLQSKRDAGRSESSANGRYGILPQGFGDGGLGFGSELTNTVWCLAGLRAVAGMARARGLSQLSGVEPFYTDLRKAFMAAAAQEMLQHGEGFAYLPMLMKEDPGWNAADDWARPRPQTGQWALSHAIYPGLVFDKADPIVRGHVALMRACTSEDVPIETGWLPHEGLWTYNAPFAAHAELWAGDTELAARHFRGFLRHASPTLCWREEQPLRGSHAAGYVGDMPHNWASAECVLYLRHMLALEDGSSLRLLEGITDFELAWGEPFELLNTPTRFGRLNLSLAPSASGWRLECERLDGPQPGKILLPERLGQSALTAKVDTSGRRWAATWR